MSDAILADEVIARLNRLLEKADPAVRTDIERLIETRIQVSPVTLAHPSIQVQHGEGSEPVLGFLGLLNGIIGTIPTGKFRDWGYIAAFYDDQGRLQYFRRTEKP